MGTPYPGVDSFTPSAQPAGKGVWVTGLEADDGDNDDSAHLMALAMAATDKCNFLAWRMIDIVSGGTFTLGGNVTINTGSYVWTWEGSMNVASGAGMGMLGHMIVGDSGGLAGDGTIYLGFPFAGDAHVLVANGSDITIQPGGTLACSGTAAHPTVCTFSGDSGAAANCHINLINKAAVTTDATSACVLAGPVFLNGTTTQGGPYAKTGTAARTELRVATIPAHGPGGTSDPDVTITASHADVWEIPVLSLAVVLTIAAEAIDFEFTIRQKDPSTQAFDLTVLDHTATGVLGHFYFQSVPKQNAGTCTYVNRSSDSLPYVRSFWNGVQTFSGGSTTVVFEL